LNKDKIPAQLNIFPYFLPMLAVATHNFLMGWTILNSVGIIGAFFAGGFFSNIPMQRSMRRALKL
jgi:hypothetical protein